MVQKNRDRIILLTGQPGVGKTETGRVLEANFSNKGESILIDHQSIAYPIFRRFYEEGSYDPYDPDPDVLAAIFDEFHALAYDRMDAAKYDPPGTTHIFTNPLIAGDPRAEIMFEKLEALAIERGAILYPVVLICSCPEEHMRRVRAEGREKLFKLTNPDIAMHIRENEGVFLPPRHSPMVFDTVDHSPAEVAKIIRVAIGHREWRPFKMPSTPLAGVFHSPETAQRLGFSPLGSLRRTAGSSGAVLAYR